jgi:hypothetical protein
MELAYNAMCDDDGVNVETHVESRVAFQNLGASAQMQHPKRTFHAMTDVWSGDIVLPNGNVIQGDYCSSCAGTMC